MINMELTNGNVYVSKSCNELYTIVSGEVFLFVVPVQDGNPGRRVFIKTLQEGEQVPSLYVDCGDSQWAFLLVAKDLAQISVEEFDDLSDLREQYAIDNNFYKAQILGFEDSLIETYETRVVTEDGFIYRTAREDKLKVQNSLDSIYDVLVGNKKNDSIKFSHNALYNTVAAICQVKDINIAPYATVEKCTEHRINVENIARVSHFVVRKITLESGWHTRQSELFLGFIDDTPVVLDWSKGSYRAYYIDERKSVKIDDEMVQKVSRTVYQFYRPLPERELTAGDIVKYAVSQLKASDITYVVGMTIVGVLIGLLLPTLNQQIYDKFIPLGSNSQILQLGLVILACSCGNFCFGIVRSLTTFRIVSAVKYETQAAVIDRLFNMPQSYIGSFENVDLSQRVLSIEQIINQMGNLIFGTVLSTLFSLLYIFKMFSYSSKLSWIAIAMLLIYVLIVFLLGKKTVALNSEMEDINVIAKSKMYQYLCGIEKIKISGATNTVINEYIKDYSKAIALERKKGMLSGWIDTVNLLSSSIFSIVFYYIMVNGKLSVSMGQFLAFNSAFGTFAGALTALVDGALALVAIKPLMDRFKAIMDQRPEASEDKIYVQSLDGDIEVNHLSFGYKKNEKILDDISLHISAGEYVAFVGPSGCGKSTMLKLLLGFENPDSGKIYYDQKDLESLEKRELRKRCGVVLQDGQLIPGSIVDNITLSAPDSDKEDIDRVIDEVGLKEDIAHMPMGIHTVIGEGASTISGGQKQRLLIARAILTRPKVIFFDEATSALDNVLQAQICQNLEKLNSTRIVIAHRLSTVIDCDRIYVFNNGGIEEEGTYEELMKREGLFYKMAMRQMS